MSTGQVVPDNVRNGSRWNEQTWAYKIGFQVPASVKEDITKIGRLQLVFDSIKTGALMKVNEAWTKGQTSSCGTSSASRTRA